MTSARASRGLLHLSGFAQAVGFAAAVAGVGLAGCATAAPYNPARLAEPQLGRVAAICQSVVGLSPSESHIPGDGNPRLDPLENHYEGCIATLSHALQRTSRAEALARADRDCRTAAPKAGAPAIAECVLAARAGTRDAVATVDTVTPVSTAAPIHGFFGTSHREKTLRMERACAAIGLDPAYAGFDACVKEMKETFYAIDNPWN